MFKNIFLLNTLKYTQNTWSSLIDLDGGSN